MGKGNDLGKDPVAKLVWKLAVPSMLAQFINVLYGIVDRIYIGNIPEVGGIALAGAGVCGPVVTLISSFAAWIGLGGAPLVAIRMGEGNKKGAEQILANCVVLLLGLAAVLTGAFFALRRPLLLTFGASEVTLPYAESYLTIIVCGTVFSILAAGLNQFIICQGYSTLGMITVVLGAVMNIVLDPIFIFSLNMGVAGAAAATVLSQAVSATFVVSVLLSKKVKVQITFGGYDRRIIKRVLSFGLSPFLILATDSIVIIALNSSLQKYGGAEHGDMLVTCATIVQSYMQLITMPMAGLTGGTQPVLSFNYGAKQVDRIRKGEKHVLLMAVLFAAIMLVLSQLIPGQFVKIFSSDDRYLKLSVWGIRVMTACIIPMAFQYTFVDGMTALGVAKVAVSLSLFRKLLMIALTLVLPIFWGAGAAFLAEPICDAVAGVTSTTVFLLVFNRLMKKREAMPDGQALYS